MVPFKCPLGEQRNVAVKTQREFLKEVTRWEVRERTHRKALLPPAAAAHTAKGNIRATKSCFERLRKYTLAETACSSCYVLEITDTSATRLSQKEEPLVGVEGRGWVGYTIYNNTGNKRRKGRLRTIPHSLPLCSPPRFHSWHRIYTCPRLFCSPHFTSHHDDSLPSWNAHRNTILWLYNTGAGRTTGDSPCGWAVGVFSSNMLLLTVLESVLVHKSSFGFQITCLFRPESEMTNYKYFKASDLYFWIILHSVVPTFLLFWVSVVALFVMHVDWRVWLRRGSFLQLAWFTCQLRSWTFLKPSGEDRLP